IVSMNLPFRGARESAITTRYVGAFVLPTRRRRMCTANSVGILLANVPSLGSLPHQGPLPPGGEPIDDMASDHAPGSPGIPGRRGNRPLLAIEPICFMSLRISANCFVSWFTSDTVVPEPAAIRRRRDPLMSAGSARSAFVID